MIPDRHPYLTSWTQGIDEVKQRLVVAPAHYVIKVVDKNGIRTVLTL